MYTLELGPAAESFERDITVMMAPKGSLDTIPGLELDAATRAALDQARAEHGQDHDQGEDAPRQVLFVGATKR